MKPSCEVYQSEAPAETMKNLFVANNDQENINKEDSSSSFKQRKSVSWFQDVKVSLFERNTPKEAQSCWYSQTEYSSFRKEIITLKEHHRANRNKLLLSARDRDDEDILVTCTSGIEDIISSKRSKEKKQRRVAAAFAVFDEQERQCEEGVTCPFRLGCVYRRHSETCAKRAYMRGLEYFSDEDVSYIGKGSKNESIVSSPQKRALPKEKRRPCRPVYNNMGTSMRILTIGERRI